LNPKVQLPAGGPTYDGTAFTSSGFVESDLPGPKEFTLSFPKPGTYPYVCLLHAANAPGGAIVGMKGTVVVQAAGAAYPMTPDQVNADVQKEMASDVAMAKADEASYIAMGDSMQPEAMADGSMKYHVIVGTMDMENSLDYQRFIPGNITVHAGDTVEWAMTMPNLHNVALGKDVVLFSAVNQPSGPPKLVLNPEFAFPAGGPEYTGTGYYNSGPLAVPGSPPQAGAQSYALKFVTAGTFEFICAVHDELGMNGHVTVLAAGQTPGMPSTGSGDNTTWMTSLATMGVLLSVAGSVLVVRRRKADEKA